MGRYAKIGQTVENLKQMINDNGGLKAIIDSYKLKVRKDLHKVDVGHDIVGFVGGNEAPTYEMIGDGLASFPVVWCFMHNKDELLVEFVLYIGHDGNLRAYIPTHGNNVDGHRAIPLGATTSSKLDCGKMRDSVVNRISVKGEASGSVSANVKLTFRQLIQSLKDFEDQHASVMPVAEGAEDPVWGIAYIWFENGILNLGQYDDEGDSCGGIADEIENCVPTDRLDEVAVIRIGVAEDVDKDADDDKDKKELYDLSGRVSKSHNVKSSVVKAIRDDDWFCKWILKFAN